jgi:hypothetical protein
MGGSFSKTTVESLQESINSATMNAMISSNQYCTQGQTASQNVSLGTIDGVDGFTIEQNAEQVSDMTCFLTAENTLDMQNKMTSSITNTIKATATANPAILGINSAESYVNSKQRQVNEVVNNINISQMQNCATAQLAVQGITVDKLLNSRNIVFVLRSTQNALTKCSSSQMNYVTAKNDLASSLASDISASSTSGLDFSFILIILVIVVAVILIGPALFGGLLSTGLGAVKGVAGLGVSAVQGTAGLALNAVQGTAGLAASGIGALSGPNTMPMSDIVQPPPQYTRV